MRQRLVRHAVPFRQAQERGELFFQGVGIEHELQPYVLEIDARCLTPLLTTAKNWGIATPFILGAGMSGRGGRQAPISTP